MGLDRSGSLVPVDDAGDYVSGDVATSDWVALLLDRIDARWSELTTTLTGSQHNLSITSSGVEADVVRCNNATDLTLTGIAAPAAPPKPGKPLIIYAVGAGNVFLSHQSGSSSAGNRFINDATSGLTPLAAGVGAALYVYDATVSGGRWRLIAHKQGAWLTPTFADSSYTGAGTDADWALAAGDVSTQAYWLKERTLFVKFRLVTTTVANTPPTLRITNAAWGGFAPAKNNLRPCLYDDNGGGLTTGYASVVAASPEIFIAKFSGNFANATNTTAVYGDLDFEVT